MLEQWSTLPLFSTNGGWHDELCEVMPTVCKLLQGKMQTESDTVESIYKSGLLPKNAEAVVLTRSPAGSVQHMQLGQV